MRSTQHYGRAQLESQQLEKYRMWSDCQNETNVIFLKNQDILECIYDDTVF